MTQHFAAFLPGPALLPPEPHIKASRHFPVMFLSDMHLGSRACRAEALLAFLQSHTADTIYLVGDIVDTWTAVGAYWTDTQHAVVRLLLDRARAGVRLIYTPGNHDAVFRQYVGQNMMGVEIAHHALHLAADGRRYLVIHGDSAEEFGERYPLLALFGAQLDMRFRGLMARINGWLRYWGRAELTLHDRIVRMVNNLVRGLEDFDLRLSQMARAHGADGVICGHFHQPALHSDHGVTYANCGDWVENATALVETASGRLMLLDWAAHGPEAARTLPPHGFGLTAKGA